MTLPTPGPFHPNLWHPYTVIGGATPPLRVLRGEGTTLHLEDGRILLDCISSWWVTLHGHAHPRIAEAIRRQAEELEHVIFAGFTHMPAEVLAEKLVEVLPPPLTRIFYSDDGSTAVETALKMALQYWKNRGERRNSFLAFEGGYHGDTFGAMATGERSIFTAAFSDLLFEVKRVPFPATWIGDEEVEAREAASLQAIEEALEREPNRTAALLVEPLVQGAGGMRVCRESYLRDLQSLLRRHGVLLILDEVMTGFGRTGEWFASERAGVEPDLLCLAKGLTGGFLPMAVTAASEEIYATFASTDPAKTLWHGHSYTANPLGCAAALASLELLHEKQEAFREMEAHHHTLLDRLPADLTVKPRVMGTIVAFDLRVHGEEGYLNQIGKTLRERALDRGLLLRPLGNTLYLMPPYSLTAKERETIYEGVLDLVAEVGAEGDEGLHL